MSKKLNGSLTRYHVYIPSKGRAEHCLTAQVLLEAGVPFTLVVEPSEYRSYVGVYGKNSVRRLPKSEQGLPYSRNRILKLSRERGEKAHWQMDDDIRRFLVMEEGKKIKVSPHESIRNVEKIFDSFKNLDVIAHRYASFAFSFKEELSYNKNPCTSILVRNDVNASWNKGTVDDADFALQVLTQGGTTIITNRQVIDTVPHNKQKGGLTDNQAEDGRRARFERLMSDYPGCFRVKIKEDGRAQLLHLGVWSRFLQRPTPVKSASSTFAIKPFRTNSLWK